MGFCAKGREREGGGMFWEGERKRNGGGGEGRLKGPDGENRENKETQRES